MSKARQISSEDEEVGGEIMIFYLRSFSCTLLFTHTPFFGNISHDLCIY